MNKFLLFILFALVFGSTRCFAQIDPVLGQATGFAVLAATEVNNTGESGVTGNVGVSPGEIINGKDQITVQEGKFEINSVAAANAMVASLNAYDNFRLAPATPVNLDNTVAPGVYVINSNLHFSKTITLDSKGDAKGVFVFVVNGNLESNPVNASIRMLNGTTPENVYWVVSGSVNLNTTTGFAGTILAKGMITLNLGSYLPGRAISLESSVNLIRSNIVLPTILKTDVGVSKHSTEGTYNVGDLITYSIKAYNNGPGTATGVVVKEKFPQAHLSFVSAEPEVGTFSTDNYPYTWDIGALQVGETVELKITFRIIGVDANGIVTNSVVIDSDDEDPKPEDNNDGDPVPVSCVVPTLAITGEGDICDLLGTYTYTVTEVPDVTYAFEIPAGWAEVSRAANSISIKPLVLTPLPGKLKVSVTDKCGKTYTAEKELAPVPALTNLTIAGAAEVCANSSNLSYTASGAEGELTYTWVATGGVTIVSGETEKTVIVNVGVTGGSLAVTAVNKCGVSVTRTQVLTIPAPPVTPVAIRGNNSVCAGDEVTYEVDPVAGAASYTWNLPDGWTFIGEETSSSIKVKIGDLSGPVQITVVANNTCSSSSAQLALLVNVSVKLNAPVGITASSGPCIGTEVTYNVISPVAGATYQWSVPTGNGWEIIGSRTGSSIRVKTGTTPGEITVAQVNVCGAGDVATLGVNPSVVPIAPAAITGKAEVCLNETNITYSVPALAGAIYSWVLPHGWSFAPGSNQTANSITVNAGTTGGAVRVKVANSCNVSSEVSFNVEIAAAPGTAAFVNDNSNVCDGLVYSVDAVAGAASYQWTVPSGFTITEGQGTTTIKVKADNYTAAGNVTVAVINTAGCAGAVASAPIDASKANGELNFPKAFSPNGDGTNDTWTIANLEKFPENEVVILNRWGSEVYKIRNYKNTWDGKGLANGTYFYKVKVKLCAGVEKEFTGYVTIFR